MDKNSPYRMPLADREEDPALVANLAGMPYKARRAARAAGLEPLLARLLAARHAVPEVAADGPTDRSLASPSSASLALEEELTLRLVAFHAQVAAAAFEAGCTADMIQKLLPLFARREQSRQFSIAVASLVTGALAGMTAGVWSLSSDDPRGPAIVGIVGGVTTTALGIAALVHEEHAVAFEHPRNRLTPIARGSDPEHLYPSFVFRMLTSPDDSDGGRTPRDELLAAWQLQLDHAVAASEQGGTRRLLLGQGGHYDDQVLALRAEMFESLESAVQGIARDLELLNRSLVRSLTQP
jgi:hypothetical protein